MGRHICTLIEFEFVKMKLYLQLGMAFPQSEPFVRIVEHWTLCPWERNRAERAVVRIQTKPNPRDREGLLCHSLLNYMAVALSRHLC